MRIKYTQHFLRQLAKLPPDLKEEILEKVEDFQSVEGRERLKVHKLRNQMQGLCSFSVTYKHRIVFEYLTKDIVVFHSVGDHDIYK